ncbi:MAG: glycosyltransferase [Ruminococcus sp.]
MKVLQINSVYKIKSTGRVVDDLCDLQRGSGIDSAVITGEGTFSSPHVHVMSSRAYQKFNILKTRLFGRHGFYNKLATKKALKFIEEEKPDIIHLHNLHGHYINIKTIFEYIKSKNIPVVWTLHDCWAFTGHCPHFDLIGCDKWKSGCYSCPQQKGYPCSLFFDRSKENYQRKKELFTGVEKMHIVTPSRWLANLTKDSFLGEYPITVINNGIDIEAFKPSESDFREKLGLEDKFIILGIVSNFTSTKGGEYFLKLSKLLSADEHIVLLSVEEDSEKLPSNITALSRVDDKEELAKIYSQADVFVNPTMQDTFSSVNMEAIACGTPVVTFATGGCPEAVDRSCGVVVAKGDTEALYNEIQQVKNGRFKDADFDKKRLELSSEERFKGYLDIYKDLLK